MAGYFPSGAFSTEHAGLPLLLAPCDLLDRIGSQDKRRSIAIDLRVAGDVDGLVSSAQDGGFKGGQGYRDEVARAFAKGVVEGFSSGSLLRCCGLIRVSQRRTGICV